MNQLTESQWSEIESEMRHPIGIHTMGNVIPVSFMEGEYSVNLGTGEKIPTDYIGPMIYRNFTKDTAEKIAMWTCTTVTPA